MRFNSRAREGRDAQAGSHPALRCVSTHAPARGATVLDGSGGSGVAVSTHAPARGATIEPLPCTTDAAWFQLTRPRGARLRPGWQQKGPFCFNSRAREGRDSPNSRASLHPSSFNSRAREGRDPAHHEGVKAGGEFQLTRPRGARPVVYKNQVACCCCFNSRAREGRDR